MTERIVATYWLETGDDPMRAAEVIAGEQSSGTFLKLAAETPELKERSGARVESLEILEVVDAPSLPGGMTSARYTRCLLTLSWPLANLGPSLPTLMGKKKGTDSLRTLCGLEPDSMRKASNSCVVVPGATRFWCM